MSVTAIIGVASPCAASNLSQIDDRATFATHCCSWQHDERTQWDARQQDVCSWMRTLGRARARECYDLWQRRFGAGFRCSPLNFALPAPEEGDVCNGWKAVINCVSGWAKRIFEVCIF